MGFFKESIEEQLSLASSSTDIKVLNELLEHRTAGVRRAVARNRSTPNNLLNILAYDPVLNVSYMAMQHPNCTVKRDFSDTSHPCVACDINIGNSRCHSCDQINNIYS